MTLVQPIKHLLNHTQKTCPQLTVSHIWSLICFPSILIILAPNSTPTNNIRATPPLKWLLVSLASFYKVFQQIFVSRIDWYKFNTLKSLTEPTMLKSNAPKHACSQNNHNGSHYLINFHNPPLSSYTNSKVVDGLKPLISELEKQARLANTWIKDE